MDGTTGAPVPAVRLDELGRFLAAVAIMLRETVTRFDETVGRISGMVVTGSSRPDRALVVTLQDFDRLQQEFAALGDVLGYFASAMQGVWGEDTGVDHHGRNAVAAISVSDLRERFLRQLEIMRTEVAAPGSEDVEF